MNTSLTQKPEPGTRLLAYKGDITEFILNIPKAFSLPGQAWLRSNIGNATVHRQEIIRSAEEDIPRSFQDWHDLPMERINDSTFRLVLPLLEVGYFEAKAFYIQEKCHEALWPSGPNVEIKVEPADYFNANIIYNAFVRQFGRNKDGNFKLENYDEGCITNLDCDGFAVIPPSGTFRDLIRELDFIIDQLGCRIIQLLPIHPTPTVYGRMGRFGSPFASLDFLDVDPALAEFDRKTTPLQQFKELIDAIHRKHGKVFLDIAINHTGWGSKLQVEHPEWFVRENDDSFYSPRAWGVIWEDLSKLDYTHRGLWKYIAKVFLTWCQRGVDGFRCDAGYKVPIPVWEYIVAKIREEFPDTIFLLEGLGGKISTTLNLLTKANLNWAYSELFQNYDRPQIENYLPHSLQISNHQGLLVHFAETHDNNRLAATSQNYARLRMALAAFTSTCGAYGFANGVEWYATDKIIVHEAKSLNWNSSVNQIEFISRLSSLVSTHPGFQAGSIVRMIQEGSGNSLACFRYDPKSDARILVLINLDHDRHNPVHWQAHDVGMNYHEMVDILSEKSIKPLQENGSCFVNLNPGEVLCLTPPGNSRFSTIPMVLPGTEKNHLNTFQLLKASALEIYYIFHDIGKSPTIKPQELANELYQDPREYCNKANPKAGEDRVVSWNWPWDSHRNVMIPPKFFLYFTACHHFHVEIKKENKVLLHRESLPQRDGSYFVLIPPQLAPISHTSYACTLEVYKNNECIRTEGNILYLSDFNRVKAIKMLHRSDVLANPMSILCTNGRGGMTIADVAWGKLNSRYDALLAANLHPNIPEDRRIMLTRCRIWMNYDSFSREINLDCLDRLIQIDNSRVVWRCVVPFCNGKIVHIDIYVEMIQNENAIRLCFYRRNTKMSKNRESVTVPVNLIIKPDIEDRNFHEDTKAYAGPQDAWPQAIDLKPNGFWFSPNPSRSLHMEASNGQFYPENEWQYMVHHRVEEERGLNAVSDLYSPGYFNISMIPDELVVLSATVNTSPQHKNTQARRTSVDLSDWDGSMDKITTVPLRKALLRAMKHFIVKRQNHKTVIAGYPWFLDWGRDTLICVRGMIAAGMFEEVKAILKQFAQFEDQGTLPNMIRGDDVGNRDTSDAPLWLVVACSDLVRAEKNNKFLTVDCGKRSILEVLKSIVNHYISGTPNGIGMDSESGLIYSPSHFTWMDTNFPAGTPRQGYPIEIQALWYSALKSMSKVTKSSSWKKLAALVTKSIETYFYHVDLGYLSDCLHTNHRQSAALAERDDHLRPNQLLAITLDALKDDDKSRRILNSCERLLIPGAIRSLDNRDVSYPLPVYQDQQLLNNPHKPYWGCYEGDEDHRRKPAYHNGTAWTWIFPSFCEAWCKVYKNSGRNTALAILGSSSQILNSGCLGQIPEILDGDFPHKLRGCIAQAWGVTELYRVIKFLGKVMN